MTTTITKHPDTATLLSFVAGGMAEPLVAAVAAHISMCPACRRELRDMELFGAAVLGSLPADANGAEPIAVPKLPSNGVAGTLPAQSVISAAERLPGPIAQQYNLSFDTIPWKRLAPGVMHHRLALSPGVPGDLRLLKIARGSKMPVHGHGGAELTLVLDGAFTDVTGAYRRGDLQDVDDDIEHRPIADPDAGCICLIASEQPARFKGLVGRLLQPWTGM
jgi:putative transcriptional regulator